MEEIIPNILQLAMDHGLMSILFVGLMIYTLKDCAKREKNNTEIIERLAEKFKVLEEIKRDIEEIKNRQIVSQTLPTAARKAKSVIVTNPENTDAA